VVEKFEGLKLYHTFAVHAWVVRKSDAEMTLFSKDRAVFT
jgi:hypothetical protein